MGLAEHLTWVDAEGLFSARCTLMYEDPRGRSSLWMKFSHMFQQGLVPVDGGYPNCSSYRDVGEGEDLPDEAKYQAEYTLQFYEDNECLFEYQVDGNGASPDYSRFQWKIQRGAEYCYDFRDSTERYNFTARHQDKEILNFKLECGNEDFVGNGIMIRRHSADTCLGGTMQPQTWRLTFAPMNFPNVKKMFDGECVRWNMHFVKFDRAWDETHYPNCKDYSCTGGSCAGDRIDNGQVWGPDESENIFTVPAITDTATRSSTSELTSVAPSVTTATELTSSAHAGSVASSAIGVTPTGSVFRLILLMTGLIMFVV